MTDRTKDMQPRPAQDPDGLEMFFDAARTRPPEISQDVMARVLADAAALTAQRAAASQPPAPERGQGWFAAIGGWPSLAALSTAMLAGIWIGYSPPMGLAPLATQLAGTDDVTAEIFNVMAGYDDFFAVEG